MFYAAAQFCGAIAGVTCATYLLRGAPANPAVRYAATAPGVYGSTYDVAKVLGDTIETVEQHYAPFVPELRERVRRIMESEPEPEKVGRIWAGSQKETEQVQ